MTNYFLPWLALTAQLPFETGDFLSNGMAFCLAVGSPALVTYSLAITILNRYWVRKRFDEPRVDARKRNVNQKYSELEGRIGAAEYLLEEAQQVPLRACQERGWFSSLIVAPKNTEWWNQLERRLRSTRRGVTASLVSQMLFAAIAYLFTVISSFQAALGDPTTALQIASGSLWIWLVSTWSQCLRTYYELTRIDSCDRRLDYSRNAVQPPLDSRCTRDLPCSPCITASPSAEP